MRYSLTLRGPEATKAQSNSLTNFDTNTNRFVEGIKRKDSINFAVIGIVFHLSHLSDYCAAGLIKIVIFVPDKDCRVWR